VTAIFWVVICLEYFQICDFGLAKWKQQAATQTSTGQRHGTVAYMAPEVFRDPNVSRTTKYDVYGFGILLWELLSDERPFDDGKIICTHSDTITSLYFTQSLVSQLPLMYFNHFCCWIWTWSVMYTLARHPTILIWVFYLPSSIYGTLYSSTSCRPRGCRIDLFRSLNGIKGPSKPGFR